MTDPELAMVDISRKDPTERVAVAAGVVEMSSETRAILRRGELPKGDAVAIARVAGILAAKKTPELIPLCHPVALSSVEVEVDDHPRGFEVRATARATDRTGVEMEALAAVAVAALTIYDMVKGIERGARVTDIRVLRKSGGRSGEWTADDL